MRYEGMLYIQPPEPRAHVELVSSRIVDHKGERHLELVLLNTGNIHVVLAKPGIRVGQQEGISELLETEVHQKLNVNLLAGEKRRFFLLWPDNLDPKDLDVQFHYESAD
jgi:hypothetical protein